MRINRVSHIKKLNGLQKKAVKLFYCEKIVRLADKKRKQVVEIGRLIGEGSRECDQH